MPNKLLCGSSSTTLSSTAPSFPEANENLTLDLHPFNFLDIYHYYRKFYDLFKFAKVPGRGRERILVTPSVAKAVEMRPEFLKFEHN